MRGGSQPRKDRFRLNVIKRMISACLEPLGVVMLIDADCIHPKQSAESVPHGVILIADLGYVWPFWRYQSNRYSITCVVSESKMQGFGWVGQSYPRTDIVETAAKPRQDFEPSVLQRCHIK
jgi:hypothetical protein